MWNRAQASYECHCFGLNFLSSSQSSMWIYGTQNPLYLLSFLWITVPNFFFPPHDVVKPLSACQHQTDCLILLSSHTNTHTDTHTHADTLAHVLKTKIFCRTKFKIAKVNNADRRVFNYFVHLFRTHWFHQIQCERNNMATTEILNCETKDDVRRWPLGSTLERKGRMIRGNTESLSRLLFSSLLQCFAVVWPNSLRVIPALRQRFRVTIQHIPPSPPPSHPPPHPPPQPRSRCGLCGLSHPISLSAPLSPSSMVISPPPLCL